MDQNSIWHVYCRSSSISQFWRWKTWMDIAFPIMSTFYTLVQRIYKNLESAILYMALLNIPERYTSSEGIWNDIFLLCAYILSLKTITWPYTVLVTIMFLLITAFWRLSASNSLECVANCRKFTDMNTWFILYVIFRFLFFICQVLHCRDHERLCVTISYMDEDLW
jgi:hypothetical protein